MFNEKPFENIDAMMLAGIQRMMVLVRIHKKSAYPYALLKSFKKSRHPMLSSIDKSQLYNILNYLEKKGYVKCKVALLGAKPQKIYSATAKGGAVASSFSRVFFNFAKEASEIIKGAFND